MYRLLTCLSIRHAGYSYSGPAAAWAYRSWDVSKAKRVFLLGPSHHFYLSKCALSQCDKYATPLGNLTVDRETTNQLYETGKFQWMSKSVDEDEHSLEMHLPYIYKILSKYTSLPLTADMRLINNRSFSSESSFPKLVPIMVGNTNAATEKQFCQLLAPYLSDPSNAFVISSDFAHWGLRFRYTHYQPSSGDAKQLSSRSKAPNSPPIHQSIKQIDFECMDACETGSHEAWLDVLANTGNTVCGRHPIGVVMAAMECLGSEARFRFVRYERSSECVSVEDSSVSYASAFAVV
jgi:predicted class III extradiol MEMO1 family dioxygenase